MIDKANLDKTNAWPFIEAKKILKERKKNIDQKGKIILQTGYGPSGLPHIGTFGEVVRTSMVVNALNYLTDIPKEIITFSDDMDGLRKVPDNVPDKNLLNQILSAGQAAASSSFLQGFSIIRITDKEKREKFSVLANNQNFINEAAEFLVFCADLKRSSMCCELHNAQATEGFTEQFIITTVDAALAAQNVVVAAESAGLGICYVGAIRNNPQTATDLLNLPKNVYPVFGLCLGYPNQNPEVKPRLPLSLILKENSYTTENDIEIIKEYDLEMKEYYKKRTDNKKASTWSEQMSGLLGREVRVFMRDFLKKRGFLMK